MGDTAATEPETGTGSAAPETGAKGASATPATGEKAAATAGTPEAPGTPTLTPEQIAELIASNERMQTALKEANGEAQKRRLEATAAERAKMTAEEAAKAELDELRAKGEEWEVERASLFLENEVSKLSIKLGIVDPDVMVRLIDWDDLTFDEGRPTNTEEVVKAILKDKPYLLAKDAAGGAPARRTGNDAGAGQGTPPTVNLSAAELAAAKEAGMTPERYQSLKGVQTLEQWQATRRTGQGNN